MADSLPLELIEKILTFLKSQDRVAASLTCLQWYEASLRRRLWKDRTVFIEGSIDEAAGILKATRKPIQHIIIKDVTFTHSSEDELNFWKHLGPNLISFQIQECFISETNLLNILHFCSSLESLHFHGCRDIFITGQIFSDKIVLEKIQKELKSLVKLCFANNCSYFSDALFDRFIVLVPHLKHISFAGTSVSFHPGVHKRFYRNRGQIVKSSDLVLTFDAILEHLIFHSSTIQHIDFSHTTINDKACILLSKVSDLKLLSLILSGCSEIGNTGIRALCETQSSLRELDLSTCSRITDVTLSYIGNYLLNLKILSLQNCRAITNTGLSNLSHLNLQLLNLQGVEHITSVGLENGLLAKCNEELKVLNLSGTQITEEILYLMPFRAPNVTHLDLTSCVKAVTDTSLSIIWRSMCRLLSLRLDWCVSISDEGFKFDLNSSDEEGETLSQPSPRVISQFLQGLNFFSVCGCSKITDWTLVNALNFRELSSINLDGCSTITDKGLTTLAAHNPSLEVVILSYCTNLTDLGLTNLICLLPRLRKLELQGCVKLTNLTLTAIKNSPHQQLTYLNIDSCKSISLEYAEQIQFELPRLRELSTTGLK